MIPRYRLPGIAIQLSRTWGALLAFAAIVALGVAACGGSDDGGNGTLRLAITDSACYAEVNVTVQKVRVHRSASADDGDSGWSEIVLDPPQRIELSSLTNGALAELGQTPLPAGRYTQLRLVLAPNGASAPFANSVVPIGGSETALTTPSGQQSGLKMNIDIEVQRDQLADFVLDFDPCKSIVRRGNSGQYNLKPVISAMPRLISAVLGYVDPAVVASGGSVVSVQQAGVVKRATPPDATGRFLLQPVLPGSYDLVLVAPGRITTVVTGVPVAAETVTTFNTQASALSPPTTTSRNVSGTVTNPGGDADALVSASQSFAMGPTIEVADVVADADTGAYEFLLAAGAPRKASFVTSPAPLVFTTDASIAGKYALAAKLGDAMKSGSADISASDQTVNFVFP